MNDLPSFAQPTEPSAEEELVIGVSATSLDLLQQVYRNPSLPLMTRMRAATAALPHEHPKLGITAMVTSDDFAIQLDRAIERSRMIETKPMIEGSANVSSSDTKSLNGKPTIIDRRYRKW